MALLIMAVVFLSTLLFLVVYCLAVYSNELHEENEGKQRVINVQGELICKQRELIQKLEEGIERLAQKPEPKKRRKNV